MTKVVDFPGSSKRTRGESTPPAIASLSFDMSLHAATCGLMESLLYSGDPAPEVDGVDLDEFQARFAPVPMAPDEDGVIRFGPSREQVDLLCAMLQRYRAGLPG